MSTLPSPDQDRLWRQLMELAEFREQDQPGHTRRVFSEPYQQSRAWVEEQMEKVGLVVHPDPVGNLIGELAGADPGLPAIVLGSHTDTVAGGGRFDGMVGVVGAIEVARLLRVGGVPLRHPLWIVDFVGEEPNRFGLSCLGSRAVTGLLSPADLGLLDQAGQTLGAALSATGARPGDLAAGVWPAGNLYAYLELHIEQGATLERAGVGLGVVTAIAGIHRAVVTIRGRADHSGTTTMAARRDALAAGAEVVLLVERLGQTAAEDGSGVATVGRLEVTPGAANVVPGQVAAWVEFRGAVESWLRDRHLQLEVGVRELARRRDVGGSVEWLSSGPPVSCAEEVRQLIRTAGEELGQSLLDLPSGASHDAVHLAHLCPMGMIFVPSRDGRSHCPEEWTEPAEVALGVTALLAAVLRLDSRESL
ncbi:MAG TPA: Zn-dependent hydrolase [Candidatus Dormibacteraeota bacterium]|nr:Zn-dependent hydrolase [Candidatus Dormibacteraeota bacterium]